VAGVAFIGSVELLIGLVRGSLAPAVTVGVTDAPAVTDGAPGFIHEAQKTFAPQIAAGEVPTICKIPAQGSLRQHPTDLPRSVIVPTYGAPAPDPGSLYPQN
jgi:hypothetical protein